ncbi:MAG: cytochrome b [Sphingomonadaceae bacterium]|nr:cytochrome b [Sphingomonadaceae bacterium]
MPDRYTRLAMVFHWTIAALIIANVIGIWTIDYFPENAQRPLINLHKSIGLTVLGLAVMRILWRVTHAPPPAPAGQHGWERTLAHLAHFALYAVIIGLPLTGYMHDSAFKGAAEHPLTWFGLFEVPRIGWIQAIGQPDKEGLHKLFFSWHAAFATVFYGLFALHVIGALKHQWLDRQRELQRMWS